jgi:hypothetical protein
MPIRKPTVPLVMLIAGLLAGCATERFDATPPSGVDLTGEWNLNVNLSDDPDRLGDVDKAPAPSNNTGHHGHGGMGRGGGGGGVPPVGSPPDGGGGYNFLPISFTGAGIEQPNPLPANSTPTTTTQSRGASINRLLQAPLHMSITQKGALVVIKTNMPDGSTTTDQYTAGFQGTIPFGNDNTAERSVGWHGPIFIVTTKVNKGSMREDDFALDEDGRLIMATLTKGGHLGKVDIKRVYDRAKG